MLFISVLWRISVAESLKTPVEDFCVNCEEFVSAYIVDAINTGTDFQKTTLFVFYPSDEEIEDIFAEDDLQLLRGSFSQDTPALLEIGRESCEYLAQFMDVHLSMEMVRDPEPGLAKVLFALANEFLIAYFPIEEGDLQVFPVN